MAISALRTSAGETVSGARLMKALAAVADQWAENARAVRQEDEYASHVTECRKDELLKQGLAEAEKVRAGEVKSFTIWQRVNQELTGECVAFLPAKGS